MWCFIWFRLISEDPSLDKTISPEELKYLTDNIQRVETPKVRILDSKIGQRKKESGERQVCRKKLSLLSQVQR